MRSHRTLLVAGALGAALWGGVALRTEARTEIPLPPISGRPAPAAVSRGWNPRQTPVVDVVRHVKDAVVNIHSERTVRAPGIEDFLTLTPSQNRVNGMGTGI